MPAIRLSVLISALLALVVFATPAQAAVVPTVTVGGTDVEMVGNDASTVGFTVTKVRGTRQAALGVTSKLLRSVIKRAQQAGSIANSEVETGRIDVFKLRVRNADGEVTGYRFAAIQRVELTVLRVKRTGKVVGAGIKAGATNVSGPRYFVSDSDERYQDALLKAFDQAKEKARALAERSGHTLGAALSITEGGGVVSLQDGGSAQPVSLPFSDTTSSAPVRSGKSRVTGEVTVVFELK